MQRRARYLIRIDDICPTMDWKVWNGLEAVLTEMEVKPILAVIPDNQDKALLLGRHEPRFWDRVRGWQRQGWTIGLHGYQHVYQTTSGGLMGINAYSEFAGLPLKIQEAKLRAACDIFRHQGVRPDVWVAPAHSFDANTVEALLRVGIRSISDGFSVYPHVDATGALWVPQQLWRFHRMPLGVWTVCLHYTDHPHNDPARFRRSLAEFRTDIASYDEIAGLYAKRRRSLADAAFDRAMRLALRSRSAPRRKRPARAAAEAAAMTAAATATQARTAAD